MAGHFSRDLTIRQLRALSAVHSAGSITSAASRLNLTQPAVTLQLRNLQTLAGLPLIQRTGDGMSLTDAGSHVLALVERIESALLDCEQSLDMIAGRTGGRKSIGESKVGRGVRPCWRDLHHTRTRLRHPDADGTILPEERPYAKDRHGDGQQ